MVQSFAEANMTRYFRFLILWSILAIMIEACAAGISTQARSQVSYFGTFSELQQQPENYVGRTVILGGKVIETRVTDGATELAVLQLALDGSDRPKDNDQSQGRYLVLSQQFLDPAIYTQGTLITVVGKVQGSEARAIGQMTYIYPRITSIEIKKWAAQDLQSPRFHFGIGVGTHL
jgi:outer membrane lipoprotein